MTPQVIPTPLTVEILDCSAEEDGSELIVWLASHTAEGKPCYLTTVSDPIFCRAQAELVAAAFRSLLGTPQGEAQTIAYVQHAQLESCEQDDHDDAPPRCARLGSPLALLVGEFVRAITRGKLVEWHLSDAEDPEAGFATDIDMDADLAIGVSREGKGFTAGILFEPSAKPVFERTTDGGAFLNAPEEINAAIDEHLFSEIESAYNATLGEEGKETIP